MGENEIWAIKSGANFIQDNTLIDSPGAQLTLRHGNENIVRRNYLRGTDGIRIFGDRNRVDSNHFEGNTGAIQIGNGGAEVADAGGGILEEEASHQGRQATHRRGRASPGARPTLSP